MRLAKYSRCLSSRKAILILTPGYKDIEEANKWFHKMQVWYNGGTCWETVTDFPKCINANKIVLNLNKIHLEILFQLLKYCFPYAYALRFTPTSAGVKIPLENLQQRTLAHIKLIK